MAQRGFSNRIDCEILPRKLTFGAQYSIANQEQVWYLPPERRLDTVKRWLYPIFDPFLGG